MKNYFTGCNDLNAAKARYKELAKAHHPDLHPEEGDEIMQQINAQYDALIARLSRVSSDGRTEATEQEARDAQTMAEAFRAAVYAIIHLEGLNIELCGAWLWVSGNTYAHREALKAAGYRWANTKKMWYWRPEEAACRSSRHGASMADIRMKYGSERIRCDASGFRPALAD